ncbi:MAG: flagellar basal body P-ring formation protein FlgA [Candidatus Omnitrophica bacterium]|nr:flagellar basal body P-ring formation protein FlgA [Candidatus Omnitrophota bacterium]
MMRKTEIKFAWLGLLLWMAASPALAVIILPENVDWSKQPNWLEDVPVQETEPVVESEPEPEPLPVPPVEEPLVRIRLHDPDRMPTGIVTLRDVADIDCDDSEMFENVAAIDLGFAPEPGETLYIFPHRIEAGLRSMGLYAGDFTIEGPERITLHGESQGVSMEQIEEAISAGLLARAVQGPGGEVEAYLIRKPAPLNLPPGNLEIEAEDLDRPGSGIRQVQLAFIVDGEKVASRTYSVRVNQKSYGLVAKRSLVPGYLIHAEDLTEGLISIDSQLADSEIVFDPKQLIGTKVVRPVAEGSPITEDDVERVPIRIRGEKVTLVQRFGNVQTTAPGELMEDALKVGQEVRVKKSNSRKTFVGRVVSPWEVEVR